MVIQYNYTTGREVGTRPGLPRCWDSTGPRVPPPSAGLLARSGQCSLHYSMKRVQRLILICFAECGRAAIARQQRPGAQCERDARGAAPPRPGARPLPRPLLPPAGRPPGGLHADRGHGHAHHSRRGGGPGSHPQHSQVRTTFFLSTSVCFISTMSNCHTVMSSSLTGSHI